MERTQPLIFWHQDARPGRDPGRHYTNSSEGAPRAGAVTPAPLATRSLHDAEALAVGCPYQ